MYFFNEFGTSEGKVIWGIPKKTNPHLGLGIVDKSKTDRGRARMGIGDEIYKIRPGLPCCHSKFEFYGGPSLLPHA